MYPRRLPLALVLLCFAAALAHSTGRLAGASTNWALTRIAAEGADGFTVVESAALGEGGEVAVRGTRNGQDGIFLVVGTQITTVVAIGAVLPNQLGTVLSLQEGMRVDAQGRVVFHAEVTGGLFRTLRWAAGDVTRMLPGDGFGHRLNAVAADGRWIAEELGPQQPTSLSHVYHLTDGVTSTEVFSYVETFDTPVEFDQDRIEDLVPLSSGELIVLRRKVTHTKLEDGRVVLPKVTTEIKVVGPSPRVLATGSTTSTPDPQFPGLENVTGTQITTFVANDSGTVAYSRETFDGTDNDPVKIELIVQDASGERVAVMSPLIDFSFGPLAVDPVGRLAIEFGDTTGNFIAAGANRASDRVVGNGDSVAGLIIDRFDFLGINQPAGSFGDKRVFLFDFSVNDANDTRGIAIATRDVTRWGNESGGAWSTAANWQPATVPVANTSTVFDLEATYDVTVDTVSSGRAAIENGSVGFRSANLTLTGPLTIGDDAIFTQPEGKITAGELTIGSLPPVNPLLPPTARFNLSNKDTEFITTGPTLIGNAGVGDLFISDAKMTSGEVRIGAGSTGTASIGLASARWTTGALAVGFSHEGTLNIERGARVESSSAVIGLGSELKNELAIVNVDNNGGPTTTVGHWFVANSLTIGDKLPGRLNVSQGASIGIGDLVKTALTDHENVIEALIEVRGTGSTDDRRSSMFFLTKAELGTGPNTFTDVSVLDGGFWHVGDTLALGEAPGSTGEIFVSGVNANGLRSELEQGSTSNGSLAVGRSGHGVLVIGDGGIVRCRQILIGGLAGGHGDVHIEGSKGGRDATLEASDFVVVGGDPVFGTIEGSPGTLTIQKGGGVTVGSLIVGRNGRVRGNGTMLASSQLVEGTIEPGVGFDIPLAELAPSSASSRPIARAPAPIQPGVLTLEGDVTLQTNGRVELDVAGSGPGAADQLVVTGTLTLGGTMALNFTDGYAPKQGDTFDLVSATATSGAFAITTISGLAPGFQFNVAPTANGALQLTALSDGVPATLSTITVAPQSVTGSLGGGAMFEVTATGTGLTYQWRKATVPIAGATAASLTLENLGADAAGDYDVVVTNAAGATTSAAAALSIVAGSPSRLVNMSVRTPLANAQNLIVGFVMQGGPKPLLIRGVGPGLGQFLDGEHGNPRITLYDAAGTAIDGNDNWSVALRPTMDRLGAFPLDTDSQDAALQRLAGGLHTAHVNGPGTGIVLVELYDALAGTSPRLINISARNRVGTGDNILIAGFVIEGSAPKTLLIRGIGPGLTQFGVSDVLVDPQLTIFDSSSVSVQSNDNWSASLAPTFAAVSAFALTEGSTDAALVVELLPGLYTAQIRGAAGGTGEALVEIYEVP